tara:strand:+ start:726 stop:932 length:207 start_codon:yes stop_codon:yes gene_type:complete
LKKKNDVPNRNRLIQPLGGAAHPWAGSLGWLEHPADNREVAGSNPASPTPLFFYAAWFLHIFLKKNLI